MDANTLGWIISATGIAFSWIALKTAFFGIKLMAGAWWFVIFMYLKTNVPTALTEGDAVHTGMLVVAIGFGLMTVLAGLGRGITRSKKWQTGEETMGGDFQWKLPSWMKFNEDAPEQRTRRTDETLADYRETVRRAYRSGEFSNRRRR